MVERIPKASGSLPRRSFRSVLGSLAKVWRVFPVDDEEAIQNLGAPGTQPLPSPFRLSVWNLYKGHGGLAFRRDLSVLLQRSDLLLAQEALLDQRLKEVLLQTRSCATHAAAYMRSDRLRDGVMSVCGAAVADQPRRWLSDRREPLFRTPKAALLTEYPLEGRSTPLRVLNLHASLFRTPQQARHEVRVWVGRAARSDGPLIVAGDFNTFSRAHFLGVSRELSRFGLRHVPVEPEPRSRRNALDQVFLRGLRTNGARAVTEVRSSDHFPLECEVRVR